MDNVEARLLRCFSVIFPELKENDLRNASMERAGLGFRSDVTLITSLRKNSTSR
jgi:hypothetical protein